MPEPRRLDEAAAQWRRGLLVLAGEIVFAQCAADLLEHLGRLALGMQGLAGSAAKGLPAEHRLDPATTGRGNARYCVWTWLTRSWIAPEKYLAAACSGANSLDLAWLGRSDSGEDRWHKRAQVLYAVGSGTNDDYTKRQRRDVLLELDAAVHCEQNIISAPHAPQQLAIPHPGPTASNHSLYNMAVEFSGNIYRELLVKKDAHRPRPTRAPDQVPR